MTRSAGLWLAAAWAFTLTTLGFFVVPMLFIYLPSPSLAGAMAAHLFQVQTGISVVCACLLLGFVQPNLHDTGGRWFMALAALGLACALAAEFWVSPHIIARDNPALWHRLGSVFYLLQWLCAMSAFHLQIRRAGAAQAGD
jgi:hypothetical protein